MNTRRTITSVAVFAFLGLATAATADAQYLWPSPTPFGGGSYVYPYQYYSSPYFYNRLPQPSIGTYLPFQPQPPLPYERFVLPPRPYPYFYYYYGPPTPYYQPYAYYYYPWVPNGPYLYRQYTRPYSTWRTNPWPPRRYRTTPRSKPGITPKSEKSKP
jgi:hypothetical protein